MFQRTLLRKCRKVGLAVRDTHQRLPQQTLFNNKALFDGVQSSMNEIVNWRTADNKAKVTLTAKKYFSGQGFVMETTDSVYAKKQFHPSNTAKNPANLQKDPLFGGKVKQFMNNLRTIDKKYGPHRDAMKTFKAAQANSFNACDAPATP